MIGLVTEAHIEAATKDILALTPMEQELWQYGASIQGRTAVIPIRGIIYPEGMFSGYSWFTSLQAVRELIRMAIENQNVDNIILDIDSGGGMATGNNDTGIYIREMSAIKPITAYVSGMACSAAYWLASSCQSIVVSASGVVGSIGVVLGLSPANKYEVVSDTSPNKRPDPDTPEGRAYWQKYVNAYAELFINTVAGYRNMTPEKLVESGDKGGLVIGAKAVEAGLADGVNTLWTLIKEVETKNNTEDKEIMSLTKDELKAQHKEIYAEVLVDGVKAESARIASIMAIKFPAGCEGIREAALKDPKKTVEAVKDEIIQAVATEQTNNQQQILNGLTKVPPVNGAVDESIDEKAEAEKTKALGAAAFAALV